MNQLDPECMTNCRNVTQWTESEQALLDRYDEHTRSFLIQLFQSSLNNCSSLDRFLMDFAPNFNVQEMERDHNAIAVKVYNQVIHIDESLTDLIRLINQFGLITTMSCQYNAKGYASISFTVEGFKLWVKKLSEYAIRYVRLTFPECEDETTILNMASGISVLRRFTTMVGELFHPSINRIKFHSGWYSNRSAIETMVQWEFLPSDIYNIVRELKLLFNCVLL